MMKKYLLLSLKSLCFLIIFPVQILWAQTTVNFNEITGFDIFGNRDFGTTYTNSGLTFTLTSNNNSSIRAKQDVGISSSIALTDGNTTPNAVTQWSIKKSDNSAFQFRSIWLQEGCNCASTQGTISAYNSSGVQIGNSVNVTFNSRDGGGLKDFAGNSDFYQVHEIRINAVDIYLFIDNVQYGVPFVPVDTDPAQVTSISIQGTPGTFATSVIFTVNFNKTALNVSSDDFQLTTTGSITGSIASPTGSGSSYTVTVNNITGEGTLRLDLKSNTNITNANGNTGTAAFTSGQVHSSTACFVETFESSSISDGATSFSSNGMNFVLGTGLEVELKGGFGAVSPGGTGNSNKYIKNNDLEGSFSLSGAQDFTMSTIDVFLSDQSNGDNPTGTGSLTLRGKKDGVIQYTISKTSGFPTNASVNGGFFTVNFATDGPGNYRNVNVDELEFVIADGFIELLLDNFNFCQAAPEVDILAPKLISSIPDGSAFSNATTVNFEVVFDENAFNVTSDDFSLGSTGTASGTISSVAGSGSVYTVTVSGISGEGSIKVNLSGTNDIRDASNNTGSPAFTSGQEHLVGTCLVETFEDETNGASTFSGNGNNFTLSGNWSVNQEMPSTGIYSSKINLKNTGVGPYSIISDGGLIKVRRLALYLSSFSSGINPTNDGTVTLKGYNSDTEIFSVTKSTGFPVDFSTNNGYFFIDFATEQGQDNSEELIDKLEITMGGSFVYLNLENFEWCLGNIPPTVANPIANQDATQDVLFNFVVPANTFEDVDGDVLTYSAQLAGGGALPGWLSFDPLTRTFSGTPLNANVGTVSIDVIANDGNGGSVTDTFDIVVANVNDAPTVANPIPNQNATEDAAFNFQFALNTFNDIDVGDVLTYTAQFAGGGAIPAWLSFDPLTRTFSGTPLNDHVGTVSIDVIANDGNGGSVTDTFDITVANVNDAPTVLNPILNQNATQDVTFTFQFAINTFQDVDVGDVLTYSAQLTGGGAIPVWLSFDPLTRTFSGTPLNANVGTVSIDVIANDGNGGSVTDTFDIVVANVNDAPTVANPIPDQNATEDAVFNFQFALNTFNDIDVGDALTYTAQLAGGGVLPAWLSFDPLTRTFSGTPANGDTGQITIEVIANDGNGGTVPDSFELSIQDVNDAPVISAPLSIAVDEDLPEALTGISFSDPDAGNSSVTATFSVGSGSLAAVSGSGVTVSGTSSSLILDGSIADLNTFLANDALTFTTSLNGTANVTLEIEINDNGNTGSGGAKTDNATVTLGVTAVNDAPVNSVPGTQVIDQNSTLTFSLGNGNQISVSDLDLGSNAIEVTLTATNGLLSLASTTGLIFPQGSGTNDGIMRFSGTLVNVNNALNGLTFTPTSNYNGPASLQIISDDQGFSGSGGAQTDTDLISITVNPINPVVTSVSSSSPNGGYKIGDVLTIAVNFSEVVTITGGIPELTMETGTTDRLASYLSGSGTSVFEFLYTVQEGDFSGDLDYVNSSSLNANGASIQNGSSLDALLTLPAPGAAGSLSANKDLIIDGIVPTITTVSVPANGAYVAGETLDFTVNFSEAVVVSGTPQLSLTIGATSHQATYVSGSGTSAVVFRYSVQTGDLDLDGIALAGSVSLNGGTIRDAAGNDANLTLNGVGSTAQVLVDAVAPSVISLIVDNTTLTVGETSLVTITFSEAVNGLTIGDFMVANGTLSGLSTSDGGVTWTATLSPTSSIQDATNVITLDNTGYQDLVGNTGTGATDSNNYAIDTQRPTATVVVSDTQLSVGETSSVTITFSEAVNGLTIGDFMVANGTLSGLSTSDGGVTWTATLTPDSGVEDATNLITLDNTGYQDLAGNTGTGMTDSNNYAVDTNTPAGYSVAIDQTSINGVNENAVSFTFADAEVGSTYTYSFSSSGGPGTVQASGTISTSDQQISAIDLSSLPDGVITLVVTLTDPAGNEGAEVSDTVNKLLPAVLTITAKTQAAEDNSDGEFEVVTDNLFPANTTVTIQVGGTAANGTDNTTLGNSFIFPANTTSVIIPVSVIADIDVEGDETVIVTLVSTTNSLVSVGSPDEATVTITDNDVPRQLTITPEPNQQKVYGSTEPGIFIYTASGFDSGDDQSIIQGALSREAGEDVGTYSFNLGNLNAGPNYELVINPEVFTISPATLTITADAGQSKVYGNADPTFTYQTAGFKNGDDESILTGALSRVAGENVGTYAINLGTLSAGANYTIDYTGANFEIKERTLTVIADTNQGKVFGAADPVLTYTASNFSNGDDESIFTGSLSRQAGEAVGAYAIIQGNLSAGDNYTIDYSGADFTISEKTLTITVDIGQNKVYGDSDPSFTYIASGFEGGDDESILTGTLTRTAGENVGNYPINLGTLDAGANYMINFTGADFEITSATLTITADSGQNKIYGDADPTFTYKASGFANGDDESILSVTLARSAGENAGNYAINLGTVSAGDNYAIVFNGADFEITSATLTITAEAGQSKVYGDADPTFTYQAAGFKKGDDESILTGTLARVGGETVGNYAINQGTLSAGNNYTVDYTGADFAITDRTLTLIADANQGKIYGEADPMLTYTASNFGNGDDESIITGSLSRQDGENIGTYAITQGSLSAGDNYTINFTGADFTITEAMLTLTVTPNQSKVYGEAEPPFAFTASGFENGDDESILTGALSRTAGENVGNYPINLGTVSAGDNYTINFRGADFEITKATLTITADDKQKTYGEENPTLTFTYSGLVNGDTQVTTEPSIATTATASSNVGTYPITLSGGSDQNYAITLVNGTLTIGQKALTITADDKQKIYGEANPTLTFTYSGLVNGDTKVATEPIIATTAMASSNVGSYPITLGGGSDQNYAITLVNGTLTIGKKYLTITADNKSKVYGEANPVLTFTYSGLVNGDTEVATEPSMGTTATASSNVGSYPITLSGGTDQNYAITLVNGTLTVNQAVLMITADSKSKIFGNPDPSLTFTSSGFKLSDTEAILSGNLTRVPGETVGVYAINQGTLDAGANYLVEFQGSELEIIPAELAEILTGDPITTPWSVDPVLPTQVSVLTQDGQILSYGVTWDKSTLNLFKRGTYTVFGTVNLPADVLNPSGQKAILQIIVLPKPAPTDINLSNNQFIPNSNVFFQEIGFFTVVDEFDDIHTVELVSGAADNVYFEIKSDILFWSSADEAAGMTQFNILVRVTDRDGNVIEKSFTILRDRKDISDIEIFNTFSPDGDGVNDTWGVPDLKYFAGGRVQVFDRSGQRVFYTESPAVRWDGIFEGKELPVGAYFWILESRETGEIRRGVLNLLRQ